MATREFNETVAADDIAPSSAEFANELFVDPAWWRVLYDTFNFDVEVNVAKRNDGSIAAKLPFVSIDDARGARAVSLPFCDFVEVPACADRWNEVVDPLIESGRRVVLDTLAGHPASQDKRFASSIDGIDYVVVVDDEPSELRKRFSTLPRRQISKAERRGIRFRLATDQSSMEAFFRLHLGVRRLRHQLLAQPEAMFTAIHEHFVSQGRGGVMVGEVDGEIVGGCLLLNTEHAVHYKFSASHPDFRSYGVSHGAVFAAIEYTNELGLPLFDFGRSNFAHGGLVDFKRRFNPVERLLARHTYGPSLDRGAEERLHELTRLFVDPATPDELMILGGNHLYRYFA